ncbi:MAG: DNA methyltransferase, partial [Solirubrobacterales bacterium]
MSRLSSLLREVEKSDPELADELEREVAALRERRAFGLNFERHVPESVELPGRPIRRGDKVRWIRKRGESEEPNDQTLWRVKSIVRDGKRRHAQLVRDDVTDGEPAFEERSVEDLVAVAEFRDPIYPGLISTGRLARGGDAPFHTVINAENYHALEALLYTHEGKADAIYIDPPYNTGAKDWKYNNDYVDSEDNYRHSKWLAFMERRLTLAARLLDPLNSVLVVTIDEKEVNRLALLLEQMFSGARIQLI